jgi:hypothetical protein
LFETSRTFGHEKLFFHGHQAQSALVDGQSQLSRVAQVIMIGSARVACSESGEVITWTFHPKYITDPSQYTLCVYHGEKRAEKLCQEVNNGKPYPVRPSAQSQESAQNENFDVEIPADQLFGSDATKRCSLKLFEFRCAFQMTLSLFT